jgi:hypothetical protein
MEMVGSPWKLSKRTPPPPAFELFLKLPLQFQPAAWRANDGPILTEYGHIPKVARR